MSHEHNGDTRPQKKQRRRHRGEGSITQLPDSRWLATLRVGKDATTGKPKRLKFYGKTAKEARAKLDEA
jgi:hypothetical protein